MDKHILTTVTYKLHNLHIINSMGHGVLNVINNVKMHKKNLKKYCVASRASKENLTHLHNSFIVMIMLHNSMTLSSMSSYDPPLLGEMYFYDPPPKIPL